MGKWEEETALILLLFPLLFFLWRTGDEGKSAFRLFSFLTSPFWKWRESLIASFLFSHASSYREKNSYFLFFLRSFFLLPEWERGLKEQQNRYCFLFSLLPTSFTNHLFSSFFSLSIFRFWNRERKREFISSRFHFSFLLENETENIAFFPSSFFILFFRNGGGNEKEEVSSFSLFLLKEGEKKSWIFQANILLRIF